MTTLLLLLLLITQAPYHRVTVKFTATERGFARVATPEVWTFDSKTAQLFPQDHYLQGHLGAKDAHVWYSYLQRQGTWGDPRQSLRVLFWQYRYPDNQEWCVVWIGNEAIEGALGRFSGTAEATYETPAERSESGLMTLPKKETKSQAIILLDQRGASFSFGAPQAYPHIEKIQYFVRNSLPPGQVPPEKIYAKKTAPRRIGGGAGAPWKPDWSPKDRTGDPRYQGDSRNPNIDKLLAGCPVPRWYEAQSHAHHLESLRSPHETGWIAAKKASNETLERLICQSLWEEVAADCGSPSPALGAAFFIDGRPGFLCFLDGTLFEAGKRYRLTEIDTNALKPAVITEGRPQVKYNPPANPYQFTECFGRERLSYLERASDKFAGQYMGANFRDFEHGGGEALVASALILADPLAKRQLHLRGEEVLSNDYMAHSTRSSPSGWNQCDLLYGVLVFDETHWELDAERYRQRARDYCIWTWQHRFELTPYQGVIGVNYEKTVIDQPEENILAWEASMQIAVAMHTATVGWRLETDPFHKGIYAALIQYYGKVMEQDYIIDSSRGGILARWSLQFKPDLNSTVPVSQQLELSGGAYAFRNWDGAEGWFGPAVAGAARILPELMPLAQVVYDHQKTKLVGGKPLLSLEEAGGWSMYMESNITFTKP